MYSNVSSQSCFEKPSPSRVKASLNRHYSTVKRKVTVLHAWCVEMHEQLLGSNSADEDAQILQYYLPHTAILRSHLEESCSDMTCVLDTWKNFTTQEQVKKSSKILHKARVVLGVVSQAEANAAAVCRR
jgi:hypothetical protein